MNTAATRSRFVKRQLTEDELLADLDKYSAQMDAFFAADEVDMSQIPSSPWGPTLSDLGLSHLSTMEPAIRKTPTGEESQSSETVETAAIAPGNTIGKHLMRSMLSQPANQESQETQPPAEESTDAPPFPGSNGDFGDYVEWATFQANIKPKFPGRDGTFEEYKEYAKDLLIEQGIALAKKEFLKALKKGFADLLGDSDSFMDDAIGAAGALGYFDKILKKIEDNYKKFTDIISDPDKLLEFGFKKGLPILADFGIDKLFGDIWKLDDNSSPLEVIAHKLAEELVRGFVKTLLKDVKSLKDLIDNFKHLQENLKKKIDEFFNGEADPDLDAKPGASSSDGSGSGYFPAARIGDKDDKVDVVETGFATVLIEAQAAARISDILTPSKKPILQGAATVFVGGKELSRITAATAIPSTIAKGAAAVLVGGPSATVLPPPQPISLNKDPANSATKASKTPAPPPTPAKAASNGPFATPDDAAKAALSTANPQSIKDNLEYSGQIYQGSDGQYYYSGPAQGTDQGANPYRDAPPPSGSSVVANYHTHADYSTADPATGAAIRTSDPNRDDFNSDNFSTQDKKVFTNKGHTGYLGTPGGTNKKFDPATGTETTL